jgi:ferredoxin
MLTAKMIKDKAAEFGADLTGIADISLFEGTPPESDPRFIAPAAKRIIGLGFRVLRGSFRGIEEGTQFYQFMEMGMVSMDERFIPITLRRLACFIEDHGYEAVVQRSNPNRRPASGTGVNPEVRETAKLHARPVAPGKPAPDVLLNFSQAAVICGLGVMGMGGFALTPEFGPFQRFAFILTDAEPDTDPLCGAADLCDKCGKCLKGCPGGAITNEKEKVTWAGKTFERRVLNEHQCRLYHCGAHSATNPFLRPDALKDIPDGDKIAAGKITLSPEAAQKATAAAARSYGGTGIYNPCVCGKACQRECYIHLERRSVLKKHFVNPFRSAEPWHIENKPAISYAQEKYS